MADEALRFAMATNGGRCRACSAEITWAVHAGTGGRMPLEPAPPTAPRGGTFALELVAGTLTYHAGKSDGPRYVSHFATCPEADKFRRVKVREHERTVRAPAARRTDPSTSHAAAASAAPAAGSIRERVLEVLSDPARIGGLTDEELVTLFRSRGWAGSPSGIRSRRAELVAAELVRDSGRTRRTELGRESVVWVKA